MIQILDIVRKELRPDREISVEVDRTVSKINSLLKKKGLKAECVKGGSIAKETFVRNDYDVDLFVRFDPSLKDRNISDLLEKTLKKGFRFERVHGSRDYFQFRKDKLLFEVVPVMRIKDYRSALNVTDMSPLHVDYVRKKLKKGQEDEIRLAKQFCKSARVYGAESYIQGFSGHILDLLIINYGSFEKLVRAAADWKPKVVIDIENHLKDPLKELNSAKTHAPLIIVDPVQPCRNAAAAMSKEKFDIFVDRCRKFLMNPTERYFRVLMLDKKRVERKVLPGEELFFIEATPLRGKKDVVGAKIMKAYEHIKNQLKKNGFQLVKTSWEFNSKGHLYFIVQKEKLSEKMTVKGPPTHMKEGAKRFKESHKKTFVKDGVLYAEEKRPYREAGKLVNDLLKDEYVKERVKSIKLV